MDIFCSLQNQLPGPLDNVFDKDIDVKIAHLVSEEAGFISSILLNLV